MKLSKRAFSRKYRIEVQWVGTLCSMGVIPFEIKNNARIPRIFIEDTCIDLLKIGEHYVECPVCNNKLGSITKAHSRQCSGGLGDKQYSEAYLINHKQTEEQKKHRSECLKKRFRTPEGALTRQKISEASKKMNADPVFIARKSAISREVQNRPGAKKFRSNSSKKMWANPEFVQRNRDYVIKNKTQLAESAFNARKYLKKTSSLHIFYKNEMVTAGLKGFITEFRYGYYHIDEADPFAKIAVEIDGCYWHGCTKCGYDGDPRIALIDKKKDTYFRNLGWIVIHIKEHELKSNPKACIEMLRTLQEKRRAVFSEKLKRAFKERGLQVQALPPGHEKAVWLPVTDVIRHSTQHKKMLHIHTEKESIKVTEDHSIFLFDDKKPVSAKSLSVGNKIVGIAAGGALEALEVIAIEDIPSEDKTFDFSVPVAENFVLASGILAHNSYSISGVSLDLEKSSKYESMKNNFYGEADKSQELAKRSIKILLGLKQPRYGIGISSALGPYSSPGVQSRKNFVSGSRGGWS